MSESILSPGLPKTYLNPIAAGEALSFSHGS
jgi:hypothetical protein